jgi:uncharacterized NAD-dependent epimerase/dehydratase family protein
LAIITESSFLWQGLTQICYKKLLIWWGSAREDGLKYKQKNILMDTAILLTANLLDTPDAKTAHGLIRESNRFKIIGVVDELQHGRDAGEVLDGKNRGIPVFSTIAEALALKPDYCIIGVATTGGIFPPAMILQVETAIKAGTSIVNGLHDYLAEREDLVLLAKEHKVKLIDVRRPKQRKDLRFWTGEVRNLPIPIVAILGTDCAIGKRTTTRILVDACKRSGVNAQMIYTGQTGWLQGGQYGFIFDSTLNDFVSGELEHAILTCYKETAADVILLEGQAALRNPSGPCGAELLISGNAKKVVLVHSPKRIYYDEHEAYGKVASLLSEVQLIKLYGAEVIAVALNTQHCTLEEARKFQLEYETELNVPVVLPLQDGCESIVPLLTAENENKID